jgi:hypothetical protein
MNLMKEPYLSRPAMTFLRKSDMAYTFVIWVSLKSYEVNFTSNFNNQGIKYKLLGRTD